MMRMTWTPLSVSFLPGHNRTLAPRVARTLSSLARWTEAIAKFPPEELLSDDNNERTVRAFLGDKLLGCAAASILMKTDSSMDTGNMTKRIGGAVSNALMAAHVERILPVVQEDFQIYSDWELGTMVEAAVATVHPYNPEAVTDLAAFLLAEAMRMMDPNCKGRLQELGGAVTSRRVGGSDHAPVWTATASLDDIYQAQADGNSKKHAEMLAASKVLDSIPGQSSVIANASREVIPAPFTLDEWEGMKIRSFKRKEGESWETWWQRGAFDPRESFNRAMGAPVVFPGSIVAVDSWTRRVEGDASAVLMVVVSKCDGKQSYKSLPVRTAPTANQARRQLGMEANEWIAQLIQTP